MEKNGLASVEKSGPAPDQQLQVVAPPRREQAIKFFRIRDLEQFQHYKTRNPPWVKLHGAQLDDYEFQQLPDAVKFHALALTYLASKMGNKIPNDAHWVAARIGAREPVDFDALVAVGFLEAWQPRLQEPDVRGVQLDLPAEAPQPETPPPPAVPADASKTLASCKHLASTETETHTEAETEAEAHTETAPPASAGRLCDCCGASVCSEFSYQDALALTTKWKAEGRLVGGRRIENPSGLARTIHREGTADDEIRLYKRPPPKREFTGEPCPSCYGAKMQTVAGKGARRCPDCLDERGQPTGLTPKEGGGP